MNLFEWLIKQHYTDLQKSVPYIKNGVVLSPEGEPFEEENERYHGALYLANGGALLEKLKVKGLVKERDISKVVGSIPTIEDFLGYLRKYQKKDGVFGVDREEHKIVRIRYVVNSDDSVTKEFEMIPDDFMSYDGSIPIDEIGTKTRLAIMLPQVIYNEENMNIEAFQIMRTPYANLGMGKVTHFNKDGLVEEFFFMTKKEYEESTGRKIECDLVNKKHGIIGVLRKYQPGMDGKPECVSEEVIGNDFFKSLSTYNVEEDRGIIPTLESLVPSIAYSPEQLCLNFSL